MSARSGDARVSACLLRVCLVWSLVVGLLVVPGLLTAQEQQPAPKKPKTRVLKWNPPQVDSRLHFLIPTPDCTLPSVLKQVTQSTNALFDGLKSFTAQEGIQFQTLSLSDYPQNEFTRAYDYLALFRQGPAGLVIQDSRTSRGGRPSQVSFDQDLGLPDLALIFLPEMQTDYDFKCEGTTEWNGQPTFVVRFQQRADQPHRSVSFRSQHAVYPASIRGRAWIATESGEVQHMETSLAEPIPAIGVRNWYLSIDYAPVMFPTKGVRMILPRTVDAYCEFPDWRTIAYHTFTDFKLFAVQVSIRPTEQPEH